MFTFHQATPDHAEQIAKIVADVASGVVEHLLDKLIPGLTGQHFLSVAFMKGEGAYDAKNVICSLSDEEITALLFCYPSEEHRIPTLMESFVPSKRLKPVRPILENAVPESLYINTIWLAEDLRGNGHAAALMLEAQSRCRALDRRRISLFCWNDNERGMRFYARQGFELVEYFPPEKLSLPGHEQGGSILCKTLS